MSLSVIYLRLCLPNDQESAFSIFTMSDLIEQSSAIKFYLRYEISAAETLTMLRKAFGNYTMSQKNVYYLLLFINR